jgi:phage baseplate assembly protein W
MAVVLGTYIVNSSNEQLNDYAIGLSLPLQMTANTFNQTYDNLVQLKSNVRNLLLTKKGERVGQPNFGTNLHRLLFEPNDDSLEDKIFQAVDSAIRLWLPQLSINEINIEATDEMKDLNEVSVSITFTANYNSQSFKVDFNING